MSKISLKWWYVLAGLAAIGSYPFIVNLLSQQFSVYKIHMGNPASYVVVFMLVGWYIQRFAIKKWGKMDWRGFALLTIVLMALTIVLVKVFGYHFFTWLE